MKPPVPSPVDPPVVTAAAASQEAPPYTPGPWFAERQVSRQGESLGWIVNHANGRIGWSSYATATPNEGEGAPHAQGGANAHLIAASPELYEALKGLVEGVTQEVNEKGGGGFVLARLSDARAALRKAEGRS